MGEALINSFSDTVLIGRDFFLQDSKDPKLVLLKAIPKRARADSLLRRGLLDQAYELLGDATLVKAALFMFRGGEFADAFHRLIQAQLDPRDLLVHMPSLMQAHSSLLLEGYSCKNATLEGEIAGLDLPSYIALGPVQGWSRSVCSPPMYAFESALIDFLFLSRVSSPPSLLLDSCLLLLLVQTHHTLLLSFLEDASVLCNLDFFSGFLASKKLFSAQAFAAPRAGTGGNGIGGVDGFSTDLWRRCGPVSWPFEALFDEYSSHI